MDAPNPAPDKTVFIEEMSRLYDTLFAAERQPELVTFAQREQRVWEIGQTVQQRLLETHLARDPAAAGAAAATCPHCGCAGNRKKRKRLRKIKARAGEVDWTREEFYCRRCRRHFSPSRPIIEDQQ